MRIRLTVEVGDATRRFIAKQVERAPGTCTKDGRARRKTIARWLEQQLRSAEGEHCAFFRAEADSRLTPIEEHECGHAIDYLRKAGKSDKEIVQWLLMQRARFKIPTGPLL